MKIRDTVFGSQSQRELFTALQSTWSRHFDLWPSLPFLNVIEVDGVVLASSPASATELELVAAH
jgi:hypothetical protein